MGSYSHLKISRLNICISKNYLVDHSTLFSEADKTNIQYYYADATEIHPGYSIKLYMLVNRLNLLGFSHKSLIASINYYIKNNEALNGSFDIDNLFQLITQIDITKSIYDEEHNYFDGSELSAKIAELIIRNSKYNCFQRLIFQIGELIDSLHHYHILAMFIFLKINLNENVEWEYYDLIEGGYINENHVFKNIKNNPPYLIITEGSSDSYIIQKAFHWIYPDIADFFEHIDMKQNYPFTGVGQIVNFYHGILKIKTERTILFIFDNDTAGTSALNKCINPPENIKLLQLPDNVKFNNFMTIGPSGESCDNINKKAASIELYFDLDYKNSSPPVIRWTSFDNTTNTYQGELINKTHYQKLFYDAESIKDSAYDLSLLKCLLDYIINNITIMKEDEITALNCV